MQQKEFIFYAGVIPMTQALQQLFVFWHVSSSHTRETMEFLWHSTIWSSSRCVTHITIFSSCWCSIYNGSGDTPMAKLACKLGLYSRECYHFWLQFLFNLQQIMDMRFPKRREASRAPGHVQAAAPATPHMHTCIYYMGHFTILTVCWS
jgi:hypothetical protein